MRTRPQGPPLAVWLLAGTVLAVLVAATAVGFARHDRPFVDHNMVRIEALVQDAAHGPRGPVVVALGASRLRHATLDEAEMAGLAVRHGIEGLRFLRIVHNSGQFADFEPFLDRILALRPTVLLLEIDLLFKERRTLRFYHQYLHDLIDVALRGRPYREDQAGHQDAKPCLRREQPDWDQDSGRIDRFMAHFPLDIAFSADSPAYERARRFIAEAQARGTRVAIVQLRSRPMLEERMYGPGNDYLPTALERIAADPDLTLWRFPAALHGDAAYCDYVHLTPEARAAYSAWLVERIAALPRLTASVVNAAPAAPDR